MPPCCPFVEISRYVLDRPCHGQTHGAENAEKAESQRLLELTTQLEEAVRTSDDNKIAELEDELLDVMYDLDLDEE